MDDHTHDTQNADPGIQALVEYYRNKSNKIEHEFLLYQIRSESIIKGLQFEMSKLLDKAKEQPKESKS